MIIPSIRVEPPTRTSSPTHSPSSSSRQSLVTTPTQSLRMSRYQRNRLRIISKVTLHFDVLFFISSMIILCFYICRSNPIPILLKLSRAATVVFKYGMIQADNYQMNLIRKENVSYEVACANVTIVSVVRFVIMLLEFFIIHNFNLWTYANMNNGQFALSLAYGAFSIVALCVAAKLTVSYNNGTALDLGPRSEPQEDTGNSNGFLTV